VHHDGFNELTLKEVGSLVADLVPGKVLVGEHQASNSGSSELGALEALQIASTCGLGLLNLIRPDHLSDDVLGWSRVAASKSFDGLLCLV
jgi:hypothetical protein